MNDGDDKRIERLGAAALGLLGGLLIGFMAGLLSLAWAQPRISFATFVFGGGAIGALIGLVSTAGGFAVVQAALYGVGGLLAGFLAGEDAPLWRNAGHRPADDSGRPWRLLFWICAALGVWLFF